MIGFSANLSMLFGDLPLDARFEAAARAGFDAVEIQFPYDMTPMECRRRADDAGLPLAMINTPPTPGSAIHGRAAQAWKDFRPDLERAVDYMAATGATRLHVMTGPGQLTDRDQLLRLAENLDLACERLEPLDAAVVIEPLNPVDAPGYALSDFAIAAGLIDRAARSNLRLLFDAYHYEKIEGDAPTGLRRYARRLGHVQIAAASDRGEPGEDRPELGGVIRALREIGYEGLVGAEYRPRASTRAGLDWLTTARQACA